MMQRWIAFAVILLFSFYRSDSSLAFDGPSFDCSHGVRQTLAVILCTVPDAALADWDLSNAYWALYSDDREETRFNQEVNKRCSLPLLESSQEQAGRMLLQGIGSAMVGAPLQLPGPRGLLPAHIRCVIDAFRERAAAMRRQLVGDALTESNLSPEDHVSIQEGLARKGFMQNRVRSFGASADGQFGPNTRLAIKDYQRSIGSPPTGFLTGEQRSSLTDTPEQRQAHEARVAAEVRANEERLAAIETAKRVEEQTKQAAIDRERKRLEEEAAKAAEWQNKIQQAQQKGIEYAKANDLNWSLAEKINPMTDDKDYEVSSTQMNDTGAVALVQGRCSNNEVRFEAVLHDQTDPKVPLGLPGSSQGGLIGKKRINDGSVFAYSFQLDKFRNRVVLTQQSFRQDDSESADTTWRVLAEIETSQGTLYIKVPMLDPKIQKLLAACKRQSAINQSRQSNPG